MQGVGVGGVCDEAEFYFKTIVVHSVVKKELDNLLIGSKPSRAQTELSGLSSAGPQEQMEPIKNLQ